MQALYLLVLAATALSAPTSFKEDDMILTRFQKIALYSNLERRNVYKSASTRWPSKTVFYKYSSTITSSQKSLIEKAFKSIESATCVKIRPADSSTENYVYVTNENSGCWSYVGFIGGRQQLNLQSNGCMYFGIITHETLHTLGFFHQQSASDRDRFINIHYDNISPGREYSFAKYSSDIVTSFGFKYDYGSIMHYGPYAFSKNGQPTISKKTNEGGQIGQRKGLSPIDVGKINKMYQC